MFSRVKQNLSHYFTFWKLIFFFFVFLWQTKLPWWTLPHFRCLSCDNFVDKIHNKHNYYKFWEKDEILLANWKYMRLTYGSKSPTQFCFHQKCKFELVLCMCESSRAFVNVETVLAPYICYSIKNDIRTDFVIFLKFAFSCLALWKADKPFNV